MERNESNADRILRVIVAVVAAGIGVAVGAGTALGIILMVVAAIMLVTAGVGFCPLYRIFGLSTNKLSTNKSGASAR